MKTLLRLLIILLIFEVISGYVLYLKNSSKLTGNYLSSTIKVFSNLKIKKRFTEKKENKNYLELECKENLEKNNLFQVAGLNFYRRGIKFQTNIDFLNNTDLTNKYLILISGNSETLGFYQDEQERIHTLLQEKLNKEFITKDIFVINISNYGQFINDHLNATISFSEIYNPDLVVFYTGGNEIKIQDYFKDMTNFKESMHIKNNYWYSSPEDKYIDKKKTNAHENCLDRNIFLTKTNFNIEHIAMDVQNYIKKEFNRISKTLNRKNIDFIFYIHPFNNEISGDDKLKSNVKKIRNMNILDSNFKNLSNKNFNLDFVDNYHTRNSNFMANKIFDDILKKYGKKINDKIFNKNN